ncbi:MAG: anthranilate synthase component I family protein [Bacteroidota bacterium]
MKKTRLHTAYIRQLADTLTPVGIFLNLRDHFPNALLLESSDYHSRADSLSFICLDPIADFEATGNRYSVELPDGTRIQQAVKNGREVWKAFSEFYELFQMAETDLPFSTCGLFGYTAFEAVQYFEDISFEEKPTESKANPDLKYQLFRYVIAIDHFKNELYVNKYDFEPVDPEDTALLRVLSLLKVARTSQFGFEAVGEETSAISDEAYRNMVSVGIAHCQRGDVFQVVLSREFQQQYKGDDFNVYRSVRSINPSPYLFYFDYGNFRIFGSSPEIQLAVEQGKAFIDPIAGTVKRTGDAKLDQQLAEEMKADPKEYAEHIMLVDLARNDLSRNTNNVTVEECAEIQYFSHVIHMVSKVSGRLPSNNSGLNVYADTFPAGTLSGAPKYRALQIINKQEPIKRNFYGGAIGFFGFDGSVNHAIIIRSVLSKNNVLTYQAGAGIVVASTPQGELEEVNNKVAAIRKAITNAETI